MCNNPIEFQLCYFPYAFERLITCYLSEADWTDRNHLSLIVDTEVWSQGDPMEHSYTLQIPNFFLDLPFGFSVHRDILFFLSRPFRFLTCLIYNYIYIYIYIYIPNFAGMS